MYDLCMNGAGMTSEKYYGPLRKNNREVKSKEQWFQSPAPNHTNSGCDLR